MWNIQIHDEIKYKQLQNVFSINISTFYAALRHTPITPNSAYCKKKDIQCDQSSFLVDVLRKTLCGDIFIPHFCRQAINVANILHSKSASLQACRLKVLMIITHICVNKKWKGERDISSWVTNSVCSIHRSSE